MSLEVFKWIENKYNLRYTHVYSKNDVLLHNGSVFQITVNCYCQKFPKNIM